MTERKLETEWKKRIGHLIEYRARPVPKTGLLVGTFSNKSGVGLEVLTRTARGVTRQCIDTKRVVTIIRDTIPANSLGSQEPAVEEPRPSLLRKFLEIQLVAVSIGFGVYLCVKFLMN